MPQINLSSEKKEKKSVMNAVINYYNWVWSTSRYAWIKVERLFADHQQKKTLSFIQTFPTAAVNFSLSAHLKTKRWSRSREGMNSIRIVYKLSKKKLCITHRMSMILHKKEIEGKKLFSKHSTTCHVTHASHVSQGMIGIFTKA